MLYSKMVNEKDNKIASLTHIFQVNLVKTIAISMLLYPFFEYVRVLK